MSEERFEPSARDLRAAGLRRVSADDLTIRRLRRGKGFAYLTGEDRPIRDPAVIRRLKSLAIPPAYRDVRIAPDPRAHLQAVGVDEAGRLQYRYHPDWATVREITKESRLATIVGAIGRIRRRIARDVRRPVGDREKAIATVVMLIDRSHIRIGCEDYLHSGRSRGATTLTRTHVVVRDDHVGLSFHGKGRRLVDCFIRAPMLARALAELLELPGRRVFQYRGGDGRRRAVAGAQVNAYLNEVTGAHITAKDFRTLAACAEASRRLAAVEPAEKVTARRRQIAAVIAEVAELLGNTPAVVRKNYVHAAVIEAFEAGELSRLGQAVRAGNDRRRDEALVAALIERRSARKP